MKNVVFITGTGRSGTNITKKILDQHSNIVTLPFEYRFTIDPIGIIDFYNSYSSVWSPFIAEEKIKSLIKFLRDLGERNQEEFQKSETIKANHDSGLGLTPYPYSGWELSQIFENYFALVDELEKDLISFKYRAVWPGAKPLIENHEMVFAPPMSKEDLKPILSKFLTQCYSSLKIGEDCPVFAEDNTWSLLFARDLIDLVPGSKMLHIYRDPRDVLASMRDQRWTPSSVENLVEYYKSIMDGWLKQRGQLLETEYLEIKFEDLVFQTESSVGEICQFIGEKVEVEMLQVDLSKSNSGRYKDAFSASELEFVNSELNYYLEIYQY